MELKLVMLGFGAVGQSLAELLTIQSRGLHRKYGLTFKLVGVADKRGGVVSDDGLDPLTLKATKEKKGSVSEIKKVGQSGLSALDVLDRADGDILIEVTSSNFEEGEPSLTYIHKALIQGMDVVTANKGAILRGLRSLKKLTSSNRRNLFYEATVGGGTPILKLIRDITLKDAIFSIQGVFNGTTNYILWKMENGLTFDEALIEARLRGYAESNSDYDIKGVDTASKLVIISNAVLNQDLQLEDINTVGIEEITLEKVIKAKKMGKAIRLVGSLDKRRGAEVYPMEISRNDPLCVTSINNSVKITTNSKVFTLKGRGAGGHATAHTLLKDLIAAAQKRIEAAETIQYNLI